MKCNRRKSYRKLHSRKKEGKTERGFSSERVKKGNLNEIPLSLILSPPLLAQRRLQHLDQLPALVGLDHDVAPAEKAPGDVDLREGRPGLFLVLWVFLLIF